MKKLIIIVAMLTLSVLTLARSYEISMDPETSEKLKVLFKLKSYFDYQNNSEDTFKNMSNLLLGTKYQANTLVGSSTKPEKLTINLNGVDCFTFADYMLALSRSENINEFLEELVAIRYVDKHVNYQNRKHFFTDWYATYPQNADDITAMLSDKYVTVHKNLNLKQDKSFYLPGIKVVSRNITYIPTEHVNLEVEKKLRTGDFMGRYTHLDGLDVSHVGIVIKDNNKTYIRNASSLKKNMKVVDSELKDYISGYPGIVVLRPK